MAKKIANLRTCASCEWIFEYKDSKECPRCGFAHYGAHYVYGKKAYQYQYTQEPWKNKKTDNFERSLLGIICQYGKKKEQRGKI